MKKFLAGLLLSLALLVSPIGGQVQTANAGMSAFTAQKRNGF